MVVPAGPVLSSLTHLESGALALESDLGLDTVQQVFALLYGPNGKPILPNNDGSLNATITALPLPAGAATSARQAAPGVAGTPSADVTTIQGEAGMYPVGVGAIANATAPTDVEASLNALSTDLNGRLRVRAVERFIVAAASAYTRPANTTAYSANDAVSNNATPASVTAISLSLSNINDMPITLERLRLLTTDTGPATATAQFRAWFFNSDPTANTGVGGGDNAAWSQKQAGFIGSMSGTFRAFSDGGCAILTPDEGQRIITTPVSGAQTVFVLLQTLTSFTPSANSTTFTAVAEGFQGVS